MGTDIRFRLALHERGNSELEIQIPTHLEEISVGESCKKMRGRIVGRVGVAGRKVGHSFSKGLVALYQRVIADPTNSGVNLSGEFF
jgi:hypothetical protein